MVLGSERTESSDELFHGGAAGRLNSGRSAAVNPLDALPAVRSRFNGPKQKIPLRGEICLRAPGKIEFKPAVLGAWWKYVFQYQRRIFVGLK